MNDVIDPAAEAVPTLREAQGLPPLNQTWLAVTPAEREAALRLSVAATAIARALSGFTITPMGQKELPRLRAQAREAIADLNAASQASGRAVVLRRVK